MQDAFRLFSPTHAAALVAIAASAWLLIMFARRMQPDARARLERGLAIANAAIWLGSRVWRMLPPRFDLATSLPLHMCPLMALIASCALIAPQRWLRTLLYFWGIGLCTQALVTPDLQDPPSSIWFWTFWLQHGFLIAIAAYDLAVRGYRPTWRDYRIACAAGLAYLGLVFPLDIVLHADYGFVGEQTTINPSILDCLGPWPERVVAMVILAAGAMTALMLPAMRRTESNGNRR